MGDRIHEIIGEIGIIHNTLIETNKISEAEEVFKFIEDYDTDVQEHYLNLLLQYYFQKNDLINLKEVLLVGAKFDMRFDDVKEAFLNIKSDKESVIEFMQENVVFVKEEIKAEFLKSMYEYYISNVDLQTALEQAVELIKRNRYVCAFCYKNIEEEFSQFFLNKDLLESLKRDLPYLIK
jgi:prolyl oligopeptidase PreP (S9A serine peptidase family)